jgi:YHS domain-containing protein
MLVHQRMYVAISIISVLSAISVGCKGTGSSGLAGIDAYPTHALDHPYDDRPPPEVSWNAAPAAGSPAGMNPALSRLPDDANQRAQQYCPVTGAKLGSMGAPVPVVVGGQTVYVCCAACVKEVEQNPERYHLANQAPRQRDVANEPFQGARSTHGFAPSRTDSSSRCSGSSCCH